MRILQVNHGYPPRYNAGSEVYTQTLARALADRHDVAVFTRQEDPFQADFTLTQETDAGDPRVQLYVVNHPRSRDRYQHEGIDRQFDQVLDRFRPDIVHIGHLNHLSTSLIARAKARGLPIVFTLHDYWLMCPRGQFMQMHSATQLWPACEGQEDRKCAIHCYARYFTGNPQELETDITHWTDWVSRRMQHIRQVASQVDLMLAPSRYLMDRFVKDFFPTLPEAKQPRIEFLDYGFDLERLTGRRRKEETDFVFGYIGTHIPAKGIQQLIEAFGKISGNARLRIYGRPRETTPFLKQLVAKLPAAMQERVEWYPEYLNEHIVQEVFDHVDAIVVPSIWAENSPLVIHEAQQARVPVITADEGGMAEYVHHEVNGLLFYHRDAATLAEQMQRFVDDPALAERLGARGYLFSENGDVVSIAHHVEAIEDYYQELPSTPRFGAPCLSSVALAKEDGGRQGEDKQEGAPGPWRITFDTNPDDCNLHCIMCEDHSEFSPTQRNRIAQGKPKRRMDIKLIERILAERQGTGLREIIPSTMGEPLVYPDFERILELCRMYNLKLNLTTNGTFPRLGATEWAKRIVPLTSDVKISWNGATAETAESIMKGVRWETVLQNVRDFVKVRDEHAHADGNYCRVTFQLTFLESNVDELAAIVKLAASLGVDRVKGHHLWAHFSEIEHLSMRRSPTSIARWNAAVEEAREVAATHLLPNGKPVLLENIFPLGNQAVKELTPGGACPFLDQEAWVAPDGRFSPCCAPDQLRRSLGDFGSVVDRSIGEIWQSNQYRALVAGFREQALCKSCNMRRPVANIQRQQEDEHELV